MTAPARQPQGILAGGQFAPDTRAEPSISLVTEKATHTAQLAGTIELHNQWFDKLPEWPTDLPEPEVSFGFDDGKVETYITVDGQMMTFWDSDQDGTINDTHNGDSPWEDFDLEDQEKAEAWGKAVHERIDSATYGVMIEGSHSPAVRDIILAQATAKEPETPAPDGGPDLTDRATRDSYVIRTAARVAKAQRELQQVYMIGAAQELQESFPVIDSFELEADGKHMGIKAAWDADGNPVDDETVAAAGNEVFRYRDEDDFSTFLDGQTIGVEESIVFRPAG